MIVSRIARFLAKPPLTFIRAMSTGPAATAKPRILNVHDVRMKAYLELSNALSGAHNCKMIVDLLKDNLDQLTDYQFAYAFYRIHNDDLDLDDAFYNELIPLTREYVKLMNREHNSSLAQIAQYAGWLNVQDDALWAVLEKKIVEERLYRYFPSDDLCKVAHAVAVAKRGSPAFWKILETEIIKNRLLLRDDDLEFAGDAFKRSKQGSPLLLRVLEAPRAEYPELEAPSKKQLEH